MKGRSDHPPAKDPCPGLEPILGVSSRCNHPLADPPDEVGAGQEVKEAFELLPLVEMEIERRVGVEELQTLRAVVSAIRFDDHCSSYADRFGVGRHTAKPPVERLTWV